MTHRGHLERVLLGMAPGNDRDLVTGVLSEQPGYTVATASTVGELPPAYDLCLLDATGLERFGAALREREAAADAYLPHLLLTTDPDEGDGAADALVDDVLTLPAEKERLARRIENLLRTRRASRRLAEREARYRELVELSLEAVLLVADGIVRDANPAAAALLGVDDGDALRGRPLEEFVPGSAADGLTALLETVPPAGEGAAEFTDVTLRDAGGQRVDVAVAGVRVAHEGGEAVQLVLRDETVERHREERLQLFGRAVEAVSHGIIVCDARADDEPIIYANEGFTHVTGYSLGEVLGRNCRFLQGPNTAEEPVTTLREAVDAGESASVDILNYRRGGTPFWNRVDVVPIRNAAGELTHFLGLQRDITEQVRREQRLTVLERILRHNVRNKTNVIRGYADIIAEGQGDPAAAAERIRTAADELLTISEQVREFDSIVRDSEDATETIDLGAVVAEGVAALREEHSDAAVTIEGPSSLPVRAHRALRVALHDLLFLLGEEGPPRAEVRLTRKEGGIRLVVTDRGGAIQHADLNLVETGIETPLEHLQGLELWLLRWAVEQGDGEFRVEADPEAPTIDLWFPERAE